MKIWFRLFTTLFFALTLDGLTKVWAEQGLEPYQPVPIFGQFFRLALGYNTGMAFGMFANGGPWLLLVTTMVTLVGLVVWLTNTLLTGGIPARAGWPIGLLLGGGIANFVDRLLDGRVIDFLDIGLGTTRWPTFNLADSFIVLGLVYLMLINFNHHGRVAGTDHPDDLAPEKK